MVPDRDFAMTVLTNSDGGFHLINDLFARDWALRRFAGISNLPAAPQRLGPADLAPYEGRYLAGQVSQNGSFEQTVIEFRARDGQLAGTLTDANPDGPDTAELGLAFTGPITGSTSDPTANPPAVGPTSSADRTATSPGSAPCMGACSDANSTAPMNPPNADSRRRGRG